MRSFKKKLPPPTTVERVSMPSINVGNRKFDLPKGGILQQVESANEGKRVQTFKFEGLRVATAANGQSSLFGTFRFGFSGIVRGVVFHAYKSVAGVVSGLDALLVIQMNGVGTGNYSYPAEQLLVGADGNPAGFNTELFGAGNGMPCEVENLGMRINPNDQVLIQLYYHGSYAATDTLVGRAYVTIEQD